MVLLLSSIHWEKPQIPSTLCASRSPSFLVSFHDKTVLMQMAPARRMNLALRSFVRILPDVSSFETRIVRSTALIQSGAFCLKLCRAEQVSLHVLHTLDCGATRFCGSDRSPGWSDGGWLDEQECLLVERKWTGFCWGQLKERDSWEDVDVDGREVCKWVLKKYGGRVWSVLMCFRVRTAGARTVCKTVTVPSYARHFLTDWATVRVSRSSELRSVCDWTRGLQTYVSRVVRVVLTVLHKLFWE